MEEKSSRRYFFSDIPYKESILKHLEEAHGARRTSIYKAAVACIYADACRFQQECTYRGEVDEGQVLALELADVCLDVLNANVLAVASYCNSVDARVRALVEFIDCFFDCDEAED